MGVHQAPSLAGQALDLLDYDLWEKVSLDGVGTSVKDAEGNSIGRREGRLGSLNTMLPPD